MSYIFINALGISPLLSRILAACGSVDYLIFACLAYFWIERFGRRRVMMVSAGACSRRWICMPSLLACLRRAAILTCWAQWPWRSSLCSSQ